MLVILHKTSPVLYNYTKNENDTPRQQLTFEHLCTKLEFTGSKIGIFYSHSTCFNVIHAHITVSQSVFVRS